MADVQLEHGHVRIANRLFEAILDAEFTGAQARILVALIRLTFGWRRRTVTLTVPELASFCRLQPVGGFRRALRELVTEGVVLQLEQEKGRTATTYAIQKDFAAWGRYSIAEARLSAVWRTRPRSDDQLLIEGAEQGDGVTLEGQTLAGDIPTGSVGQTPRGQSDQPHRVIPTGSKSFGDETVDPRKDSERQGKTDVVEDIDPTASEYALALTVTANQTITEKWGEQPTVLHFGASQQLAADLRDRGVPLDVSRASIIAQLARRRPTDAPPRSIQWFRQGIEQAWAQEQQRQLDATTSRPAPAALAGAPDRFGHDRPRVLAATEMLLE